MRTSRQGATIMRLPRTMRPLMAMTAIVAPVFWGAPGLRGQAMRLSPRPSRPRAISRGNLRFRPSFNRRYLRPAMAQRKIPSSRRPPPSWPDRDTPTMPSGSPPVTAKNASRDDHPRHRDRPGEIKRLRRGLAVRAPASSPRVETNRRLHRRSAGLGRGPARGQAHGRGRARG